MNAPVHVYEPVGSALELFYSKDPEVLMSGCAGTGKSRAALEKVHLLCMKYPGIRVLMIRKTLESLTKSILVLFQNEVIAEDSESGEVVFFGGSVKEPPAFKYGNGSTIVMGGMDKATRVLSSQYDVIYVNEAVELSKEDWEMAGTRLRNNKMPYQQMIADTNPSYPSHWLKKRCESGVTKLIYCHLEDNPAYYDRSKADWTRIGKAYYDRLESSTTGIMRERYFKGKWVAAEGIIYEDYDPAEHLLTLTRFPRDWPRYWSVDFGYKHPLVIQVWAQDPDGDIFLTKELFRTETLVEDAAREMKKLIAHGEPPPRAVICDHQAESRAVFEKHTGYRTIAARKDVLPGIELVKQRLKPPLVAGPRNRLFLTENLIGGHDAHLLSTHQPASTAQEMLGYVWGESVVEQRKESPHKFHDDGMDAMRYMCMHLDGKLTGAGVRFVTF